MKRELVLFLSLVLLVSCEKPIGGNGGSEVGNGGDPEFVTAEHGLRYAYGILERIDPNQVPAFLKSQYSSTELQWFTDHRADLVKVLKEARLHWVDELPPFCEDHTVACARAGDPRIYVLKKEAPRFKNHREAAGNMIHEGVHLIGEANETLANRVAVFSLATWNNMGHPEAPHWIGMTDSPLTQEDVNKDPYLLRWQYVDWSQDRLYVWDERFFQSYNPVNDSWEMKPVAENPFDWKRSKGTFAIQSHYPMWLEAGGIVYVACRFNYGALTEANASGVFLDKQRAAWRAMTDVDAPSDRMYVGFTKTENRAVIWGGQSCSNTPNALNTGGFYDPKQDTWETIEVDPSTPTPRYGHGLLWSKDRLAVWGGVSVYQRPGELGVAQLVNDGAFYDPKSKTWEPIVSGANAPGPRMDPHLAWTGSELIVFGGRDARNKPALTDGAIYNPRTKKWRPMAPPAGPHSFGPFDQGYGFWTGSTFGFFSPQSLSFYDLRSDSWSEQGRAVVPGYERDSVLFWTGFEGVLWKRNDRKGALLYP
ncbi:MAG: hypothetical protein KDD51_13975 [Bdellovibrionales bacterium]|nr:hypothetical protein [Bdellovibrionales bacterium]